MLKFRIITSGSPMFCLGQNNRETSELSNLATFNQISLDSNDNHTMSSSIDAKQDFILNQYGFLQPFWMTSKADNGFPRKSAYSLHYNHIRGTSPRPAYRFLVWPVGLGTSMTRDMSGYHAYTLKINCRKWNKKRNTCRSLLGNSPIVSFETISLFHLKQSDCFNEWNSRQLWNS